MKRLMIVFMLVFGLTAAYAGDLYIVKAGQKEKVAAYSSQEELVGVLAEHLAAKEDVQAEKKEIYGLMFFVMPAPKETSIVRQVDKRILDFYNFPGNYDLVKQEGDRLYRTKEELLKSGELKKYAAEKGFYEMFIIGIDVKNGRMHSISKPNGQRIFLDSWYRD